MGKTWQHLGPIYDKSVNNVPVSSTLKISHAGNSTLIAAGYEFFRDDPEMPVGNMKTGGVLDDCVVALISKDLGKTWVGPKVVATSFKGPVEASSPVVVLNDGSWVSPVANFPDWSGKVEDGFYGRLMRSNDQGKTWNDEAITMEFPGRKVTVYEQRLCQLQESCNLVVIAWNEDVEEDKLLCNHYALSYYNGRTFCEPMSTGIMGQASSITPIGGDKILSLHCIRRNSERPGIYGCVVNLSEGKWEIECESMIWEPGMMKKNEKMAEVFSYLRFGQPSAIQLSDRSYLMCHWVIIEDGNGKILWTKLNIFEL